MTKSVVLPRTCGAMLRVMSFAQRAGQVCSAPGTQGTVCP
jgi:hypothetical protein